MRTIRAFLMIGLVAGVLGLAGCQGCGCDPCGDPCQPEPCGCESPCGC